MNNKKNILSSLALVGVVLVLIGATYAYLSIEDVENKLAPTEIKAHTVDTLTLSAESHVDIVASVSNFDKGMGNIVKTAKGVATLSANSKTNVATKNYFVYFDIASNTFKYTTEEKTPELLLQIKDPNGVEITEINGLDYVSVTYGNGETVTGFDITELDHAVEIATNYEIVATEEEPTTIQKWQAVITFVNLSVSQKGHVGTSFNGYLELRKVAKTLGSVCDNQNLARCLKENHRYDNNLYYHDENLENGAGDNSVRYAGSYKSVNNYVCFGTDEEICPYDNLYRIIGVFGDNVKLIKADYAKASELEIRNVYGDVEGTNRGSNTKEEIGVWWWNGNGSTTAKNIWAQSSLNTQLLNNTYLNKFNEKWQAKIEMTNWKVGGNTIDKIRDTIASIVFKSEVVKPLTNITESKKIGLMYVSDYGFAASPSAWTISLYNYGGVAGKNWMHNGLWEWTITNEPAYNSVFIIRNDGLMYERPVYNKYAMRPCFYLIPDVIKTTGIGTKDDPMRLI